MKKAFIKRPLSALLTVIMMLSALPLLATGSSAALPGGLDSYITVNSDKIAALSKKATTDGLIKKLTDYNWCMPYPALFHIKDGILTEHGDYQDRYTFTYQYKKGSNAEITYTHFGTKYKIVDIGLDNALILVEYGSSGYTYVSILSKCNKRFHINSYGGIEFNSEDINKYNDYENYIFSSPFFKKNGINDIKISGGRIAFSPKTPSFSIFNSDLDNYNLSYPSHKYGVACATTKNSCSIWADDLDSSSGSELLIDLFGQGNNYFAFIYTYYGNNEKIILEEWTKWFGDVPSNAWYYNSVKYVYDKGIMSGYSNGRFGSVDNLKRQDFVVILSKLAKADLSNYANTASKLKDVKKGAYYAAAVNWAVDNNIIAGYANGNFGVGDNITREQIATILYRYTGSPTVKNPDKTLSKFKDGSLTSAFAKDAVAWAVLKNVISGKSDGRLAPTSFASRAEIATIIMNADKSNALVY